MDFKKELIKYAQLAEDRGFVTSLEGNLSLIDRETGLTYVTPSGTSKTFLTEDQVCVMDAEGNQVGGNRPRTSEYLLHEAALKILPEATACIHTHAPYLSAYADCLMPIRIPITCQTEPPFDEIPCLPYGTPGTHEIHAGLEDALKKCPIVLLGRHGAMAVGADLAEALGLLQFMENQCHIYDIAKRIVTPPLFTEGDGVAHI